MTPLNIRVLLLAIVSVTVAGAGESTLPNWFMSLVSSKMSCLGLCYMKKATLKDLTACQLEAVTFAQQLEKEGKIALTGVRDDDFIGQYQAVYNRFIKSRSIICKEIYPVFNCIRYSKLATLCGNLGKLFIDEVIGLVESRHILDCKNPTSHNMMACIGHPDVLLDFTIKGLNHACVKIVTNSKLYERISKATNPVDEIHLILTNADDKRDLCSLYGTTTSCFRNVIKNMGGCGSVELRDVDNLIADLTDLVGCGKDQDYHDGAVCALQMVKSESYLSTKCITSEVGNVFDTVVQTPSMPKLVKMCPLVLMIECLQKEVKNLCQAKWTWTKLNDITMPFIDYFATEIGCGGTKKNWIADCKCLSADYPFGGEPDKAVCDASQKKPSFNSVVNSPSTTPDRSGSNMTFASVILIFILLLLILIQSKVV